MDKIDNVWNGNMATEKICKGNFAENLRTS